MHFNLELRFLQVSVHYLEMHWKNFFKDYIIFQYRNYWKQFKFGKEEKKWERCEKSF